MSSTKMFLDRKKKFIGIFIKIYFSVKECTYSHFLKCCYFYYINTNTIKTKSLNDWEGKILWCYNNV